MLKAVKNNKNTVKPQLIKVSYNNEKCYKCNESKNLTAITNDCGSLSYCKICNIYVILFEYIEEKDYNDIVENSKISSRMFSNASAFKKENAYFSR